MFKEFFVKSPLMALPMVSLALFTTLFVAIVAYVLWRGRALEARGSMALDVDVEARHE